MPLDTDWFTVVNTPYGIFVYDVTVMAEGLSQMGWWEE